MNVHQPGDFTVDAFHREKFWLVQPAGRGHRAGMDAMLLAAAIPDGFSGQVADLGAGAGAAGFAVVARCPGASATLVERDQLMVECAQESVAHERNNHLNGRIGVLRADVSLAGEARTEAGLADRSFDAAIMNPPFNDGGDRQSPDELKRAAHVMEDGMFDTWMRTAAAILRPGGSMALITRPASLHTVLVACENRFGALGVKPIHPQVGKHAIRVIVRGISGSRAGMTLHPPLFMHEEAKEGFSAEADAICNGRKALFGD